ncbi:hypothetical protein BD769DRAFT_1446828 [Suillus cothurnatus]|nr:hypothetical protein BD769DRAFT_1446828 [Suillus cothurnatus]
MAYVSWSYVYDEPTCQIITRPATRKIISQLHASCDCGGNLIHQECPDKVTSVLYQFRGGYYEHNGNHDHTRPTHILHLTKSQCAQLESIVALYTGIAGLTGPQPSGLQCNMRDCLATRKIVVETI